MFAPGLMLILGSAMAILVPILLIGRMNRQLLLAPGVFRALPAVTVWDYSRRLEPVSFAIRDQFGTLSLGQVVAYLGPVGTLRFPTYIAIFTFNGCSWGWRAAGGSSAR